MKEKKSYTLKEIRDKLAAYCAYQDRCHLEVENKMKKFYLAQEAEDDIMLYLMRENFLNEERFAKSFARGKFYQKSWGRIKIKIELKRKHITPRLIAEAMGEIDAEDYDKTMQKLIEKKMATLNERDSYKKNQKVIRYMLQKGYEYELIKAHLDL
ncbi:MAG: regulatory protein RecX [Weeksellaceae bacterium]